jgi:hypothetical protein
VFPNTQYGPAFGCEQPVDLVVTFHVPGNLDPPELGIRLRRHAVRRAGVPEAAVHEDNNPCGDEGQVRAPGQSSAEHVAESRAPEKAPEAHLDGGV